MAVRSPAGTLQALLDQAPALEELAEQVQGDNATDGLAALAELTALYRRWFSTCVDALPDDLKGRFRTEHDGNFMQFRIRHFLKDGRKSNVLYRPDLAEAGQVQLVTPWQHPHKDAFLGPFHQQLQCLEEALARLGSSSQTLDALELLEQICRRLPITFSILGTPPRDRAALPIRDEYDVQHVLHAIAVLHFEEVEPEEPTPKMASASSRLDFLLKQEQIAIETKMTRDGLGAKQLRDELAKDIIYFRAHPHVKALFIFVYDPARKVTNARGFERDLNADADGFTVRIVIAS